MIFLHLILGIGLGALFGDMGMWIVACTIIDVDHLYIYFVKHKMHTKAVHKGSFKRFYTMLLHEKKYGIQSRTPLLHSFLGGIIISLLILPFSTRYAVIYGLGHLSHLILDAPDRDVKQYFYPFKYLFRGPLPVWSRVEQVVTGIALVIVGFLLF